MNDLLKKLREVSVEGLPAPKAIKNPWIYIIAGIAALALGVLTLIQESSKHWESEKAMTQAAVVVEQVRQAALGFRRVLEDEQVLALTALALENPEIETQLRQYLAGRLDESVDVLLSGPKVELLDPVELGAGGFIVLDMLFTQASAPAPLQVFDGENGTVVIGVAAITAAAAEKPAADADTAVTDSKETSPGTLGYLAVMAAPETITSRFSADAPVLGYIALEQANTGMSGRNLKTIGNASLLSYGSAYINVPGTLFRVVVPQDVDTSWLGGPQNILLLIFGLMLLAFGILGRIRERRPVLVLTEDPEADVLTADEAQPGAEQSLQLQSDADNIDETPQPEIEPAMTGPEPLELPLPEVDLPDLVFDLEKRRKRKANKRPPVELKREIFKAYDIRGIIGETLDDGIAHKVGQAVGSMVVEQNAGPVVVARDGRHSGPDMLDGLISGLVSTGCDVVNIGMAPTGVLYYAANEVGSGSGVMVTGSHNPPNYNGLKMMIGGITLSGDDITGIYNRLVSGNVRVGRGSVTDEDMLPRYRERIISDIQLDRPLRVVVDCGNGVGGVNAVDVLRSIGAEVLPLFDEVDGDFPNHHPDPSDPDNMQDLIECVQLMNADIGVAFDGDADRLGVATPDGEIIYSDRVMMLYARDVLSRVPGATIIYDVKCTGHLDTVIKEAGGNPVMYKTGHSLIKNRMKELNSPFSGEMSGHFFFGERWYGVDDGIYAAARLLEILAKDEREPVEVLSSLPNSVSTPELKVHMKEGEHHAFIERFRKEARFEGARISKIDGLRADWEDGWGLVRASNTTPVLVLRFDADSQQALNRIQMVFRTQLQSLGEPLNLPF
jgi:phosphomannomutase